MQAPHVSTCAPNDADCGGEQQSCIIELVPLYSKAAKVMEEDAKLTGRSSGCSDYLRAVPVADDPLFIPNWGHPFNLFQISSHHCMKFQGILYSFSSFRSLGLRRHLEEYSGLANIIGGPERDPGMSRKTTTKPPHNRIHQARDENNPETVPCVLAHLSASCTHLRWSHRPLRLARVSLADRSFAVPPISKLHLTAGNLNPAYETKKEKWSAFHV